MRRLIETAPRDGKFVILEEDASGKYNVACWSPEVDGWVGESGEPIRIAPTYWHPIEGQKYAQQGLDPDFSVRPAAPQQMTAGAVAASGSVAPAPAAVAEVELRTISVETRRAWPTRWTFAASAIAASLVAAVFASMHSPEVGSYVTRYASLRDIVGVGAIGGPLVKQAGQPSENEQSQVLAKELADARRTVDELNLKLRAEATTAAQFLGQEREKTFALMQDVDAARKALTASTAQHREALEEERARSSRLASELTSARGDLETKVALSNNTVDELAQLRKAAEAKAAELAAAEQPVTSELHGAPEAARLTTRARALLAQGNIGAARIVLERAAEMGSAEASFALAETYDPHVLSTWGTYGTRGDASKARELYAKATVGGIREAKDRFNALRP